LKVRTLEPNIINEKADVLVIGGGLAGCCTALSAVEEGAEVVIFEKADIRRSGSAGPGLDEAQLVDPDITISTEEFRETALKRSNGMVNAELLNEIAEWMGDSKQRLMELEEYGVNVLEDGKFRLNARHHNHEIWFDGKDLKPRLAAEVKRRKIKVHNHTLTVGLLKGGGAVVGALGMNVRDGTMVACVAPSTVIATGAVNRLYHQQGISPFVNDYCPACAGDGHYISYEAGALIAGMEFTRVSVKPKKHWVCRTLNHIGAALYTADGDYLIEAQGAPGASKTPTGAFAAQQNILFEALSLQMKGVQMFWDASEIPESERVVLQRGMENEKPIGMKFSRDTGFDFRQHPMEGIVMPWTFRSGLAGVVVGHNLKTTLDGLYAVGDVVGGTGIRLGGMMCIVYAHRLGKIVSRRADGDEDVAPDNGCIEGLAKKALSPMNVSKGYDPLEVERRVRHIVTEYAGMFRSGAKLAWGVKELERFRDELLLNIKAETPHGLMRAFEARCLATVAEMHLRSALFRTESRLVPMHYRTDYPKPDDENWKSVLVSARKRDGGMEIGKMRLDAGGA